MRVTDERGSVLLLVPAGVLALVILGAIAVDHAVVALGQRELAAAVAAAANDAATAALDERAFYEDGAVLLHPGRAESVAEQALAARLPKGLHSVDLVVTTSGRQVCVSATAVVDHVFSPGVPGVQQSTTVSARATATATAEDEGRPPVRAMC